MSVPAGRPHSSHQKVRQTVARQFGRPKSSHLLEGLRDGDDRAADVELQNGRMVCDQQRLLQSGGPAQLVQRQTFL